MNAKKDIPVTSLKYCKCSQDCARGVGDGCIQCTTGTYLDYDICVLA